MAAPSLWSITLRLHNGLIAQIVTLIVLEEDGFIRECKVLSNSGLDLAKSVRGIFKFKDSSILLILHLERQILFLFKSTSINLREYVSM